MMDENASSPNPLDAAGVMKRAIVVSALNSARIAEDTGLPHNMILLSAKVSNVQDLIDVNRMLAAECDYALHLGLTEAGWVLKALSPPLRRFPFSSRRGSETPFGHP